MYIYISIYIACDSIASQPSESHWLPSMCGEGGSAAVENGKDIDLKVDHRLETRPIPPSGLMQTVCILISHEPFLIYLQLFTYTARRQRSSENAVAVAGRRTTSGETSTDIDDK